ncbi:MAG: hypothetical protein JWN69_2053 [Alphaproteobacteria bacterium]|nr:hypothetical protein [Alphaproteobacteria bacterium]
MDDRDNPMNVNDEDKGEGNYRASREYNEGAHATAQDQEKVTKAAKDAERALEGDEAEELKQAEAEGRSHAKS